MNDYDIIVTLLKKIILDKESFKKSLNEFFKENNDLISKRPNTSKLIGCIIRHVLFLDFLYDKFKLDISFEDKCIFYIVISNNYFLHMYDEKEIIILINKCAELKNSEQLNAFLSQNRIDYNSFKSEFDNIITFLSIRYNTPRWLIKMWNKHYGKSTCLKILKANNKNKLLTCRVNPYSLEYNNLISDNESLIKTDIENIYFYKSANQLKKYFSNDSIFNESPTIKVIVEKALTPFSNSIFLYSDNDNSLIKELFIQCSGKKGLYVGVPNIEVRADIMRMVRINKDKNIKLFELTDYERIKSVVTSKQNLVICMPNSSSFNKINNSPEYLLNFNRLDLDNLIQHQNDTLALMANFVEDGGTLLYLVDTLNKKESVNIIDNFIIKNPNFILKESEQYFPFDKLYSSMYYAILERRDIHD